VYGSSTSHGDSQRVYRFVSVFKWEPRKGWEALLTAYLLEFQFHDHVRLGAIDVLRFARVLMPIVIVIIKWFVHTGGSIHHHQDL
jgi:hypothetical protein